MAGRADVTRRRKPPPPGPGRPHGLDNPYTWPATGELITVSTGIIRWMRTTGCQWDEAAAACAVPYDTVIGWFKTAGTVNRRISLGIDGSTPPTEYETRCFGFSREVAQTGAENLLRWQGILEREGEGGFEVRTVREKVIVGKDGAEDVIERVTTTEIARPDTQVLRWRMGKLGGPFSARYADRPIVEINAGPGVVVSIGEPSDQEAAREFADNVRMLQAIEAKSTESDIPAGKAPRSPARDKPATTKRAKRLVE